MAIWLARRRLCPDWVRKQVRRICALAKVPEVTAHRMRGCTRRWRWRRVRRGTYVVAAALGHQSFRISKRSYVKREALDTANQQRVLTLLDGGKLASSA